MVVTAADGHRIFLCQAQTGNGFSGIQNFHMAAGSEICIVSRQSGGGRQCLQEV